MPRQLIESHRGDKRYVRRDREGRFTSKQVNVGRSLAADRRSHAKTKAKKGEGERGDRSGQSLAAIYADFLFSHQSGLGRRGYGPEERC
jgi:hypothetical protein